MSIISAAVPNLVNGISQQPYSLRLPSQAEAQVNGLSSVSQGLLKRPPSRHVAKITGTPLTDAFLHTINRDASERYEVIIQDQSIRVFDLAGNEKPVNAVYGLTYLNTFGNSPGTTFSAFTEADYTFIVNKLVAVEQLPSVTPARPHEGLVWVKQGAYQSTYTVVVNGVPFTYTTPAAIDNTQANYVQTSDIAGHLYQQMAANFGSNLLVGVFGSIIHITSADGSDFTLSATDGIANTAMVVCKDYVQSFERLPANPGRDGIVFGVKSVAEGSQSEYYVRYDAAKGVWSECAKPGEADRINEWTMPFILRREADGSFTFTTASWEPRQVGDLDTVPMPSFVGKRVNDIFFFKNRLGILADENVILSRSGEFFNFFRASAIQTLDTDPIDIAGTAAQVSILKHAVPFSEALLLFSDEAQFMMGKTDGVFSPKTVSMAQTTAFECDLTAKPVGCGQNVYFAAANGQWSALREYFVDVDTRSTDAAEVTAHCPAYLPAGIKRMAASTTQNMVVALSRLSPSRLYVYRFYWAGAQQKLQSSWSYWDFGVNATLLDVSFIENNLWLLVSRPDGVSIERVDLQPQIADPGLSFSVRLDRRLDHTQAPPAYNPATNSTSFTMPYWALGDETYKLVALGTAGDSYKAGQEVTFTIAGQSVTAPGKLSTFVFGAAYEFRYRFSTFINRVPSKTGDGTEAILDGRLQLHYLLVNYNQSGYFQVEVKPSYRDAITSTFTGRLVGSGNDLIGALALETGNWKVPIRSKNDQVSIDLVSDSFLPCAFLSAEWTADYVPRSQRT